MVTVWVDVLTNYKLLYPNQLTPGRTQIENRFVGELDDTRWNPISLAELVYKFTTYNRLKSWV